MFNKKSLAVLALTSTQAVRISADREPLLSWNPVTRGEKSETSDYTYGKKKKSHPVDYAVPNFGVDSDIIATQKSYTDQEIKTGITWKAQLKKDQPKGHPINYAVPDFGKDSEVRLTQKNIQDAEKKLNHKWVVKDKKDLPKPHPVDYFVPNFGQDSEISYTQKNIAQAEQALNTKWNPILKAPKGHAVDYAVPNFGIDSDIKASLSNLGTAEKKYGKWDLPKEDVQLEAEIDMDREPLLSWNPISRGPKGHNQDYAKAPKSHPVDYFVPNFGKDHEIRASQTHEAAAEAKLGHNWVPKKDENDKWILPPKSVEFKLLQTESAEDAEREPLLSWNPVTRGPKSHTSDYTFGKKKKGHPVDYPVPNFGVDSDVTGTWGSISQSEQRLSHKWVPTLKKDLPKPHPVNYAVANFGTDHDIKTSLHNLKTAEKKLGKWDLPKDE